eukprot:30007-Hanusia_phi.AAC.6
MLRDEEVRENASDQIAEQQNCESMNIRRWHEALAQINLETYKRKTGRGGGFTAGGGADQGCEHAADDVRDEFTREKEGQQRWESEDAQEDSRKEDGGQRQQGSPRSRTFERNYNDFKRVRLISVPNRRCRAAAAGHCGSQPGSVTRHTYHSEALIIRNMRFPRSRFQLHRVVLVGESSCRSTQYCKLYKSHRETVGERSGNRRLNNTGIGQERLARARPAAR